MAGRYMHPVKDLCIICNGYLMPWVCMKLAREKMQSKGKGHKLSGTGREQSLQRRPKGSGQRKPAGVLGAKR